MPQKGPSNRQPRLHQRPQLRKSLLPGENTCRALRRPHAPARPLPPRPLQPEDRHQPGNGRGSPRALERHQKRRAGVKTTKTVLNDRLC